MSTKVDEKIYSKIKKELAAKRNKVHESVAKKYKVSQTTVRRIDKSKNLDAYHNQMIEEKHVHRTPEDLEFLEKHGYIKTGSMGRFHLQIKRYLKGRK